jgi:transketolase
MDAVQQANSGHSGTPMAMAPVVYVLWQEFLRFDPEDPIWPNRDRFILSAGHASTLGVFDSNREKSICVKK